MYQVIHTSINLSYDNFGKLEQYCLYLITALYNKRNNCLSTNVVIQDTKKINNGFNGSQSDIWHLVIAQFYQLGHDHAFGGLMTHAPCNKGKVTAHGMPNFPVNVLKIKLRS